MKPSPFSPIGEQEGKELEMLALQRTRNGFQGRLLPATAGFFVSEDLVGADYTDRLEMQSLALRFGPKHEGRVAVRSPSNCDGSIPQLIQHHPMLSQDRSRVSLGDVPAGKTDQSITVTQESGGGSRNELRIVNRHVR